MTDTRRFELTMTQTSLTPAIPRDPQTILRRGTRYAIVCTIDGHATTIGYTNRPSARTLLQAAQRQSDAILPYLAEADMTSYTRGCLRLGPRVTLTVGDTERRTFSR